MTVTLHNVQRTVNRDIALCALHPRSVRSEDGRMNLAKIRHERGLSQRDLGEMIGKIAARQIPLPSCPSLFLCRHGIGTQRERKPPNTAPRHEPTPNPMTNTPDLARIVRVVPLHIVHFPR